MSTQTMHQRQALAAYISQLSPAHNVRGEDAEVRRSTERRLSTPQAVRRSSPGAVALRVIDVVCELVVDHGWWLLVAIPLAAKLVDLRASGRLP